MKNMRSNLLKLGIFLTILATNTAFGWDLGIANYTKAVVHLEVRYVWGWCTKDNVSVQPGQIIHVNAKSCLVNEITGVAVVNGKNVTLEKQVNVNISGRDFSINIVEIGSSDTNKTYRIERVM